jgi:ion channel
MSRPNLGSVRFRLDPPRMPIHRHLRELARRQPRRPHHVLRRRLGEAMAVVLAIDLVGAALMWAFEAGEPRGAIHNLWDAFFFSTVQLLTVSSQMPNPVTTAGRIVDIFLELLALVLVTSIAGVFASFYLHLGEERDA